MLWKDKNTMLHIWHLSCCQWQIKVVVKLVFYFNRKFTLILQLSFIEKVCLWKRNILFDKLPVPYHGFFDRELVLTKEIVNKGNKWGHPFDKNYGWFYETLVGRYGIFISVCIFNFTKDIHSDTKRLILLIYEPRNINLKTIAVCGVRSLLFSRWSVLTFFSK